VWSPRYVLDAGVGQCEKLCEDRRGWGLASSLGIFGGWKGLWVAKLGAGDQSD